MIRFEVAAHAGHRRAGTAMELPEVLLPLRWWRSVPLVRRTAVDMTPLERFTVELALTTGRADPAEFTEITGLPGNLLAAGARRLVQSNALIPDDSGYAVWRPMAEQLATEQVVHEYRTVRYDLVLLPRTGDLLALDPKNSWLEQVEQVRARPVGNAPVPAELRDRDLTELLGERLAARTVHGVGQDLLRPDDPGPGTTPVDVDGVCPAYRCAGALRLDGDRPVPVVTIPGERGDPVVAELTGADGLARYWIDTVANLTYRDVQARLWREVTGRNHVRLPHVEQVGLGRWRYTIDGSNAELLAGQGRNLALPLAVTATATDLVAELTIDLAPGDSQAKALVALDRSLTSVAEDDGDPARLPNTPAVRDRAWQLGFQPIVYALREAEDFSHD
ncbi:hypothetical protein CA850_01490 [Micromonospora echinospora]|uniref:Uncharacterized protein n=1 Tax=Micromonospora echinospora TaxID=1877 RepID=A0A1C4YAS4_MICEC|nr:hypothetical protein [Micromonospora echinospora]OZV84551.1 hypothetical protein CA850_01490 [Micromonospora echinospora]SCF17431.1 hypothetical protein GA0070618_3721 [Micromonospora echinospora]